MYYLEWEWFLGLMGPPRYESNILDCKTVRQITYWAPYRACVYPYGRIVYDFSGSVSELLVNDRTA